MRIRRAAARTFTSKYVRHCSSVISRAGTAPKMPRLFHQNVNVGKLALQLCRAILGRHVDGDADDVTAQFRDGLFDALWCAPIHRDAGTTIRQPLGNGEAHALRRPRDEGRLSA